jgi:hypothetical protein
MALVKQVFIVLYCIVQNVAGQYGTGTNKLKISEGSKSQCCNVLRPGLASRPPRD